MLFHLCVTTDSESTTVEIPQAQQLGITAVVTALGVTAGLVLPRLAGWALGLPWTPWRGPLELVDRYATGWVAWALPALGLVVGLLAGLSVVHHTGRIRVSPTDVVVIKGDELIRFSRAQVTQVRIEDRHLVLRGQADEDLIREKLDVDQDAVLAAATRYDWPTAG